jgi:hypothetical protein
MTKVSKIDSFAHTFVDACVKEVIGARVGFINTECTFVKTLLKGIAYKTMISSDVLNDNAQENLDYIVRKLTYD